MFTCEEKTLIIETVTSRAYDMLYYYCLSGGSVVLQGINVAWLVVRAAYPWAEVYTCKMENSCLRKRNAFIAKKQFLQKAARRWRNG